MIGPPFAHVLEEDVAEDLLLYDTENDSFVSLNSTGADVWRLANGQLTLSEIVDRLAGSYQVAPTGIGDEVSAIVDELIDAGLLQTQHD